MKKTLKIYRRTSVLFGIGGAILSIFAISMVDTIAFVAIIRPYFIGLLIVGCVINAPLLFFPFLMISQDDLCYKKLGIFPFKVVPLKNITAFSVKTQFIDIYYNDDAQAGAQYLKINSINIKDHDKSELINLLNQATSSQNT